MRKKILSLFLSVAMLITMSPLSTYADNIEKSSSGSVASKLDGAISAEKLEEDVTLDDCVVDGEKMSLNGNSEKAEGNVATYDEEGEPLDNSEANIFTAEEEETNPLPTVATALEDKKLEGVFDGRTVTVTGNLPVGATLSLAAVDMDKANDIAQTMSRAEASFACDIKIIDKYGMEWQPDESVNVSVSGFEKNPGEDVQFIHIDKDITKLNTYDEIVDNVQVIKDCDVEKNSAEFETDGFSTFIGVSGFTVDFHYGNFVYSIEGMSTMTVKQLMIDLGMPYDASKLSSVEFTDESLVLPSINEKGEWIITSLKAFTTNEEITFNFNDGRVVKVPVTDSKLSSANYKLGGKSGVESTTVKISTASSKKSLVVAILGNFELSSSSTGFEATKGYSLNIYLDTPNGAIIYRGAYSASKSMIRCAAGASLRLRNDYSSADIPKDPFSKYLIIDGRNYSSSMTTSPGKAAYPLVSCSTGTSTGSIIYFRGTEFRYATNTSNDPGGVSITGVRQAVDIGNCKFSYCNTSATTSKKGLGGGLRFGENFNLSGSTTCILRGCTFTACTAFNGGGLYLDSKYNDPLTITSYTVGSTTKKTSFVSCAAKGDTTESRGGAINIGNNAKYSSLTLSSVNFNNCNSVHCGGAAVLSGTIAKFTATSCNFYYCDASNGSAIYYNGYTNHSNATFTSCNFYNNGKNLNSAGDASGDYANWKDDSDFGGTIRTTGGTKLKMTMNSCKIYSNKSCRNGGGIYFNAGDAGSKLTLNSCQIYSNVANSSKSGSGGGIYCESEIDVNNCKIYSNTATGGDGGGIMQITYSTDGRKITNMENDLNLDTNTAIYKNTARNGGGIYLKPRVSVSVSNTSSYKMYLTVDGADIYSNTAYYCGGGVGYDDSANTKYTRKVVLKNGAKVYSNTAYSKGTKTTVSEYNDTTRYGGGGVYLYGDGATMSLEGNCQVYSNKVTYGLGGGVLQIGKSSKITFTSGTVRDNKAASGGGIAMFKGCSMTFSGGNITGNSSTRVNSGTTDSPTYVGGPGGGVLMGTHSASDTGDTFTISGGSITNNTATNSGGGIHARAKCTVKVTKGTISENKSTASMGAGITIVGGTTATNKTTLTVSGGTFTKNIAYSRGGAVYTQGSVNVNISGSPTFTYNQGSQGGAFATLMNDSAVMTTNITISGGTFSNNQASANGGAIYVYKTNKTLTGTKCIFTMNSGTVTNNKAGGTSAGGGISLHNRATRDTTNDTTYEDSQRDSLLFNFNGGTISKNTTNSHGGGIMCESAHVIIRNEAKIEENTAVYGGGISVIKGGRVDMLSGYIRKNKAVGKESGKTTAAYGATNTTNVGVGGGVYVDINSRNMNYGYANTSGDYFSGNTVFEARYNVATYTYEDKKWTWTYSLEGKYKCGIYSNTADFAGDDIASVGGDVAGSSDIQVKLAKDMDLAGYTNGKIIGWYEDYADGDTRYTVAGNADTGTGTIRVDSSSTRAYRYRDENGKKCCFEKADGSDFKKSVNTNTTTQSMNNAYNYVCATLGIDLPGSMILTSEFVNEASENISDIWNDDMNYYLYGYDESTKKFVPAQSIVASGDPKITYKKNGSTTTLPDDGSFVMTGGDKLEFEGLKGKYVIIAKPAGDEQCYVKQISYVNPYDTTFVGSSADDENFKTTHEYQIAPFSVHNNDEINLEVTTMFKSLTVNFSYYDRDTKTTNGIPADIDSTPTTLSHTYLWDECLNIDEELDAEGEVISRTVTVKPLIEIITGTGVSFSDNYYKSVIDDYYLWLTQSAAETGLSGLISNGRAAKYSDETKAYRADQYGRPVENENWVSYIDINSAKLAEADSRTQTVAECTLWLYNTPKQYNVTLYESKESDDLVPVYYTATEQRQKTTEIQVPETDEDGNPVVDDEGNTVMETVTTLVWIDSTGVEVYGDEAQDGWSAVYEDVEVTKTRYAVDTTKGSTYRNKAYYNQRLGNTVDGGVVDSATNYLTQYGIAGYIGYQPDTNYKTKYSYQETEEITVTWEEEVPVQKTEIVNVQKTQDVTVTEKDEEGKDVEVTKTVLVWLDANGNEVATDEPLEGYTPVYVQALDADGNPMFEADGVTPVYVTEEVFVYEQGDYIYKQQVDENGELVFDAQGNPVYAYETEEIVTDEQKTVAIEEEVTNGETGEVTTVTKTYYIWLVNGEEYLTENKIEPEDFGKYEPVYETGTTTQKTITIETKTYYVWSVNGKEEYTETQTKPADIVGVPVYVVETRPVYDDNGNLIYIYETDENGEPLREQIPVYVQKVDETTGELVFDEKGEPVWETEIVEKEETHYETKTVETPVKFAYWSFDPNGDTVASVDYRYNYRITDDVTLYAIYEEDPSYSVGVTTTMSDVDIFVDDKGVERTRLNTVMNPYYCFESDSNIAQTAVMYVIAESGAPVTSETLETIRERLATQLATKHQDTATNNKYNFVIKHTETVENDDGTTTEKVVAQDIYYVYIDSQLTNKNRVMFTGTFKTASLADKSVAVFTAMCYNGEGMDGVAYTNKWIVSDNCAQYIFDNTGAIESNELVFKTLGGTDSETEGGESTEGEE